MPLEVIDETDAIIATDRLVERIRGYQQMKIFTVQLVFLVVIASVLLNIIASLLVEFLFRRLSTSALYALAISSSLVLLLSIMIYFSLRRYFTGGLGTFVHYEYALKPKRKRIRAVDFGKDLWNKLNIERKWKTIYGSTAATTKQSLILLRFQPKSTEMKEEPEKHGIHFEGEFIYFSFLRFRDKFLGYDVIEVPNLGKMKKICTCTVFVNLIVAKKEDRLHVELNSKLELTQGIDPKSDELIQEAGISLRTLSEELRRSLEKST